ncbi:hypothetical protein ABW19_dt0205170 [Dactylella cylindrospora]|nr:hypothetical protein ABW19_dt0205170 [Dactylella cylindrospora]
MDLEGNTYWEFRDRLHPHRPRRIADFRGGVHSFVNYSEFKVDPQWHQWLRATRLDPPTIPELQADVIRRQQMIERARLADERWAAKGSLLRKPKADEVRRLEASAEATATSDGSMVAAEAESSPQTRTPVDTTIGMLEDRLRIERERRKGVEAGSGEFGGRPAGPSEEFQPAAWSPKPVDRGGPRDSQ